jgi:hypothetical protein
MFGYGFGLFRLRFVHGQAGCWSCFRTKWRVTAGGQECQTSKMNGRKQSNSDRFLREMGNRDSSRGFISANPEGPDIVAEPAPHVQDIAGVRPNPTQRPLSWNR